MNTSTVLSRVNPFVVQWNSNFFVGREDELRIFEQNLAGLRQGQQSHLLVAGIHGTGKTFYLNKLAEITKSTNCVAAVVDCPEGTPLEQARSLVRSVINEVQVQTAQGLAINNALSDDFDKQDKSQFFSLAKRSELTTGCIQDCDGLVVCIDEGQRTSRQLLSAIKNALSRLPGIQIVLSLRVSSDTKGAAYKAREDLLARVSETEQDKDIGVVAFYSSVTAMGPFKTDAEVAGYFTVRLQGNAIRFSNDVILGLAEIANRVPRPMTDLAHIVYEEATKRSSMDVDIALLNECFRTQFPTEIKEATDLCADLSRDTIAVLKAVCRLTSPVAALDIVENAFPGIPQIHHQLIAEGVGKQLDKLAQLGAIIIKTEDNKYHIVDSFRRYALKLSLGVA